MPVPSVGLVEVGGRDRVLDLDAQDLAAQVVGVQRRTTVITGGALIPAALLRRRRGQRRRRAGQRRAVARDLGDVLLVVGAAEEHVDVGRVHRTATRLDLIEPDVRKRLEGRVDLRRGRVVGDRSRRLAVEGQRERAARGVGRAHGLLLVGQLVLERAEAVGADARRRRVIARDHPQVAGLVEVDVTRDVTALLAVVVDPQDLLLRAQVQVRRGARGVVDELEARELEIAHVRIPRRLGGRRVRDRSCSAWSA